MYPTDKQVQAAMTAMVSRTPYLDDAWDRAKAMLIAAHEAGEDDDPDEPTEYMVRAAANHAKIVVAQARAQAFREAIAACKAKSGESPYTSVCIDAIQALADQATTPPSAPKGALCEWLWFD